VKHSSYREIFRPTLRPSLPKRMSAPSLVLDFWDANASDLLYLWSRMILAALDSSNGLRQVITFRFLGRLTGTGHSVEVDRSDWLRSLGLLHLWFFLC
jgi:hypothetical protein